MSVKRRRFTLKRGAVNLLTLLFAIASIMLLSEAINEIKRASQTKKDLVIIENEIKEIEQETKDLEELKVKLSDSNYVQNYARGKHLMSKSEEQVFILPKPKE
ncbi:MAG TPA: septum formation initiator family protein [Erysipelothrix sp.]|nr:septum formation initiator family protein [Erysipelothrix sp.]